MSAGGFLAGAVQIPPKLRSIPWTPLLQRGKGPTISGRREPSLNKKDIERRGRPEQGTELFLAITITIRGM